MVNNHYYICDLNARLQHSNLLAKTRSNLVPLYTYGLKIRNKRDKDALSFEVVELRRGPLVVESNESIEKCHLIS